MGKIVLYSTGCSRCSVLKNKLTSKHLAFEEVNDVVEMAKLGITTVPWLAVDGQMMDFAEAVRWVNAQEVQA